MKNNKRHIIKKRLHEVPTEKNYSGEASPYWDFMLQHQDVRDKMIEGNEDPIANPDVLPEEQALYHRPLSEQGKLMMQAVDETMIDLTPQQQNVMRLSLQGVWLKKEGQRVYSEQAIADAIGVTNQAVSRMLARIKTKIRRRYEKLKTTKE